VTSTFNGISTALSGLMAQRRGLDVTGQNIANANTDGYSRQRVNLVSVSGSPEPALFSITDSVGGGVSVADVARIRDAFLDARSRNEHATNAYYTAQKQMYGAIEQTFNEPSDTGLQSQLGEFWSAWQDVANVPLDDAARTQLLERANTTATTLNNLDRSLGTLWSSEREQLGSQVTEINTIAANVAKLNGDIVSAKNAGLPAMNELADQRDVLVGKLADLTGGVAYGRANGTVDVYLGGSPLVSGLAARSLKVVGARRLEDQRLPADDPDDPTVGPVGVKWTDSQTDVTPSPSTVSSGLESLNIS